jgi:hypothetical protein
MEFQGVQRGRPGRHNSNNDSSRTLATPSAPPGCCVGTERVCCTFHPLTWPTAVQGQIRQQQAEAEVRRLEKRIAELMTEKRVWELELYGDSVTGTLDNRKPLQGPSPVDMWSVPTPTRRPQSPHASGSR